MTARRLDPDETPPAASGSPEERGRRDQRGKLVVFFGGSPGVGKTYAMLEAGRDELDHDRDVVAGIVESHGRYDTEARVLGFELLPRRRAEQHGAVVDELDLDAALARRPDLILVDDLAHTNAPGSRHAKRWQDVEEMLDAGIDVFTTLNVQHIESLNDVVARVTGVVVRETVPDRIVDEATELRLIDLPPDELLERLAQAKAKVPEAARRALEDFSRKGNLIALRELALRRTADRVDAQMRVYKTEHGIDRVWPAGERILVGVSPSPASARLVRAARRMAGSLHAQWIAVYVETPASLRFSEADKARVAETLRLAEQLGGEAVTLAGQSAARETLAYARARNVTKIVVGKPTHPRWRDLVAPSVLEEMVRSSDGIDVYVISGDDGDAAAEGSESAPAPAGRTPGARAYAAAIVASAATTGAALAVFHPDQLADVVMVYLLGIIVVAIRYGYRASILATVLAVLLVDFFFVPPFHSFAVTDFQHVVTFGVMFVVAVVISGLAQRVRDQADAARQRERRTASLYGLTRELAGTLAASSLSSVAARHVHDVFDAKAAILLRSNDGRLVNVAEGDAAFSPDAKDDGVVAWVHGHHKPAGLGTDTLPGASALYVPLRDAGGSIGVLGVRPRDPRRFVDPDQRALLDVFAAQITSALERARLAEHTHAADLQIEAERLRSALLSSVSHDLRTPLAVITGAASALLQPDAHLSPEARRDLDETIYEEADRLNRLVRNLLDMTRITSGAIKVAKEWQPLEEVVGAVLNRLDRQLEPFPVGVHLPPDLPPVPIDAVLIEQLLINLLENAAKYTLPGAPIDVEARRDGDEVVVSVADRGPGIPEGETGRIFEKFYRLPRESAGTGAGLGLAICRGIAVAHGGRIWAEPRDGGGAVFSFTIPIEGTPPVLVGEDAR